MSERGVFTMRAQRRTLRALEEEARRYGVPPRTLAERMIEEGIRMRRHPGIVFLDRGGGRDAVIAGRPKLSVWQVAQTVRATKTRAAAAKWLSLDEMAVDRAMAYAKDHPDEIEQAIRENDEAYKQVERLYPSTGRLITERRRAARSR
jgi:uncharacterized protein (DUF433 family)